MSAPLRVVILGGGTSGWMCAAALSGVLKLGQADSLLDVRLIESDEIGTVGVGEATLPQIKDFNDYIGINEAEFMRRTKATFKLGIEFRDWGKLGNNYHHPFGAFGMSIEGVEFQHCWTRARALGQAAPLEDYSYAIQAARAHRFDFPSEDKQSIKSTFAYAYHFDAGLYAAFLREFSEARGLRRTEGKVRDVNLHPDSGHIRSLVLDSGEEVSGDLFIDCSGFRALLIEDQLMAGWDDWSRWLPCDRALAVPSERTDDFHSYTRSTALAGGWQWRIPLQHRTGNGYVYSSAFISDDEAHRTLLANLEGAALADAKPLRFKAGRRRKSWYRNCLTVGLSSGFLEPLESTSIYLVQIAVTTFMQLLPSCNPGERIDPKLADEFNRLIDNEYERVRDFLILHYHANTRTDAALWEYTRNMSVPDSLIERIGQYRHRGYIRKYKDGLFSPPSWLAVLNGQDIPAEGYDRMADTLNETTLIEKLESLRSRIRAGVDAMPDHAEFVRDYCYVPPARAGMTEEAMR
ncbi:MAG: tryptophan 7-halogenase [Asticcacaulis sp.]|uniref:tryptophan halogenase family protein n=1 Tax=Asticcacaulis sp. TaxID=1872648 RepID=UPI0039E6BB38